MIEKMLKKILGVNVIIHKRFIRRPEKHITFKSIRYIMIFNSYKLFII